MGPDWLYRVRVATPVAGQPGYYTTDTRYTVDPDEVRRWRDEERTAGRGVWVESAVVGDFYAVRVAGGL